jgi:hypothetical protein
VVGETTRLRCRRIGVTGPLHRDTHYCGSAILVPESSPHDALMVRRKPRSCAIDCSRRRVGSNLGPAPSQIAFSGSGLERNVRRTQFGKLAIPRELKQSNEFKTLRNCLGKKRLVIFQRVYGRPNLRSAGTPLQLANPSLHSKWGGPSGMREPRRLTLLRSNHPCRGVWQRIALRCIVIHPHRRLLSSQELSTLSIEAVVAR